jgi:hypothetical protein
MFDSSPGIKPMNRRTEEQKNIQPTKYFVNYISSVTTLQSPYLLG